MSVITDLRTLRFRRPWDVHGLTTETGLRYIERYSQTSGVTSPEYPPRGLGSKRVQVPSSYPGGLEGEWIVKRNHHHPPEETETRSGSIRQQDRVRRGKRHSAQLKNYLGLRRWTWKVSFSVRNEWWGRRESFSSCVIDEVQSVEPRSYGKGKRLRLRVPFMYLKYIKLRKISLKFIKDWSYFWS